MCVRAHHRPDVDDNKDLDGLSRRRPSRALILFPVQFDWGTREQQASSLSPSPSIIHLLSPCAAAAWLAQIGNGACGRLDAQDAPRRPTAYGTQITPTPRFFFLVVPWVWIWSGSNWITSVADAFESASASVSVGGGARAGMVCVMGHQQAWAGGLTGWGGARPAFERALYV